MEKAQIIVYPAIFSPENNTYNVTFPDVPEAITFGENITEAVIMAQSALGLALYERTQMPLASSPKDIHLESDEDFVVMISLDLNEYRRKKCDYCLIPACFQILFSVPIGMSFR